VRRALLAFSICCLVLSLCSCRRNERGLGPGNAAPEFALPDLSGTQRSLSDFKGKVVLVTFWASWCGTCMSEMPDIQALYQALKPRGLEMVAIGCDDEKQNFIDTARRLGLTFPILLDASGEVKNKYKVTGYPESFVLNREGKIQMLIDADGRSPIVRVAGARPWNDAILRNQFEKLLN
jgi:peroxiredoxin